MNFLLRRESPWIPFILLVILVGCWSELDLYAPSFPEMMHYFSTTEQMMQWTLSLNFLGFFLASLLCGPLADAVGRRPVILWSSAIFVAGSALCLFANTVEMLLLGRFIQGIGVSGPVTICQAVIADIYQGEQQVKLLSRTNSIITITMAMAPIVGVFLTKHLGWQANFMAIFAVAIVGGLLVYLFVPETHKNKAPFKFGSVVTNYRTLLVTKDFMVATLAMCFSVTPYFILIGIMPLLFMEQLGVSLENYAMYQGSIVGLYSVLSLMMPKIMAHFDVNRLVVWSVLASVLSLMMAFTLSQIIPDNPTTLTGLMWVYCIGIVLPPTMMFVRAMDMFDNLKASASSLIQSLRMLSMAIGTSLAGSFYDGTYKNVGFIMLAFVVASVPLMVMGFRKMPATTSPGSLPAMH